MPVTLKKIDLVVFDLDDTLYPERQFVDGGLAAVAVYLAGKCNLSTQQVLCDMVELFDAGQRGAIFQTVLKNRNVDFDQALIDQAVQVYRQHRPELTLFDDAARALKALGRLKKLAILTDGYLQVQSSKAQALGLDKLVDQIVYTDTWGAQDWKPSPRGFLFLQNHFSVPPERCIYIADNVRKDFVGPNQLGWQTLIVKRPKNLYQYDQCSIPPGGQPRWSIMTLDELEL